jgi:uncharacterized protein (DUF1697 family)
MPPAHHSGTDAEPRSGDTGPRPERHRPFGINLLISAGHNGGMASHVALLRGINVGGRNKVPMAELREVVASLGHTGVTTYIQSGNVLFSTDETDTAKLAAALEAAIEDRFGIWSAVVVLSRDDLAGVLSGNPYTDEPDSRRVHVVFLNAEPAQDMLDRIAAAQARAAAMGARDTVTVVGRALFLHTPDGYGNSELAKSLSNAKTRNVVATARNWATATRLLSLCDQK